MDEKKIIILGASRYYAKSIEAAQKAGYYIIAIDRDTDAYSFRISDQHEVCDIVDKRGVLKLAQKHKVSGIIPINDYGVPTAAFVAQKLGLPGISPQSALWATNKELMRKKWMENGINCPKVLLVEKKNDFYSAIKEIGLPCILKPAHGYGGASRGVIAIREEFEIEEAISFSQQFYEDKATLVESFIESELEHSAEVIIYKGNVHVIAIADKIKTPLPYRVDKNVLYPTKVKGEKLEELKINIQKAVSALEINTGAAHVEIASTTKGDFVLFELGARCGGGGTPAPIVPYVTGINQFVEVVRILAGDKPENLIPTKNRACNYHFITPSPGKVKSVIGIENISQSKDVLDFELFVKNGDNVKTVKTGIDRAGFIIVGANEQGEALKKGIDFEKMLKFKYY